ncbi:uncharacterized protein [Nicotiana sylvestris]|uniref:uncharacterized protein n=1 Tax=Nicotiana sylvestris TaxID=4096 RepID=UPI00388CCB05
MGTPDTGMTHEGSENFRECLARIEDGPDLDALFIFDEAERLLKQTVSLHRQAFTKSWAELARCKAELKKLVEERDILKILYVKKEGEISDLRFQQKGKLVEQLREELYTKKAETLGWKKHMDSLASEKDALREQLTSIERQLQNAKEESLARSRKIEELKDKSAAELAKAKSMAEGLVKMTQRSHNQLMKESNLHKSKAGTEALTTVEKSGHVRTTAEAASLRKYKMALNNDAPGNFPLGEEVDDDNVAEIQPEPQAQRRGRLPHDNVHKPSPTSSKGNTLGVAQ